MCIKIKNMWTKEQVVNKCRNINGKCGVDLRWPAQICDHIPMNTFEMNWGVLESLKMANICIYTQCDV